MTAFVTRSSAIAFAPVLVAVQVFYVVQRGDPWRGEWAWSLDWAAGATVLTGPLVAACAGFEVLRWRDRSTATLLRSTRRGHLSAWLGALSVLVVAAVVQAVATAAVLVVTAAAGAEPETSGVLTLLLPFAVLATAALLGATLAVLWPSLLAVPTAAAVIFAVTAFPSDLLLPDVMTVGGSTGSLVGLTWDVRQQLGALAVLLATCAVLAMIVRVHDAAGSSVATHGVLVGSTLLLVVAAAVHAAGPDDRLTASERPIDHTCAPAGPSTVCLAAQTSRQLPWLARQVARQSAALTDIGIEPPRRYEQLVPYHPLSAGAAPIDLGPDTINARVGDRERVADLLADPAFCPADTAEVPPPSEVFAARAAISAWIAVRSGIVDADDLGGEIFGAWLRRPVDQQRDWIATTYDQLRRCRYDDVRLPAGVVLP